MGGRAPASEPSAWGARRVMVNVLSLAGPGLKHDIQRAFNVRNLSPETALEQPSRPPTWTTRGAYDPKARLRDMDVQGIDQVMIIPSDIDTYPWIQSAPGAQSAMCKAYNEWALRLLSGGPRAHLLRRPCSPCRTRPTPGRSSTASPRRAVAWRWSAPSTPGATIQSRQKFDPLWRAMEELGDRLRHAPLPRHGRAQAARLHGPALAGGAHPQDLLRAQWPAATSSSPTCRTSSARPRCGSSWC